MLIFLVQLIQFTNNVRRGSPAAEGKVRGDQPQLPGLPAYLRADQGWAAQADCHRGHRDGRKAPLGPVPGNAAVHHPNTIQRAYNELEGEGYIYSVPGKGSFATGETGAGTVRRRELFEKARELLAELKYLGVSQEELMALLEEEPSGGAPAGARKEETR